MHADGRGEATRRGPLPGENTNTRGEHPRPPVTAPTGACVGPFSGALWRFRPVFGPDMTTKTKRAAVLLHFPELGQAAILPTNKGSSKHSEYSRRLFDTNHRRVTLPFINRSLHTPPNPIVKCLAQATMNRLPVGGGLIGFVRPSYWRMTLGTTRRVVWLRLF